MKLPNIADLVGTKYGNFGREIGALSCMGLILEVYRRAGIVMADPATDPKAAEEQWAEVEGDWEPGDVLGVEAEEPGFVGHSALYLGWGIALHSTPRRGVEIVAVDDLPRPVIVAYRHAENNGKAKRTGAA